VQAKVREGSPGGRSETTGVGFVQEVGFKTVSVSVHAVETRVQRQATHSTEYRNLQSPPTTSTLGRHEHRLRSYVVSEHDSHR